MHLGKSGGPGKRRRLRPDGKGRTIAPGGCPRPAVERPHGVTAGEEDRRRLGQVGRLGAELDRQHRLDEHAVAERAEARRGLARIRLGSEHEQAQRQVPSKKAGPPRWRSSAPASAPRRAPSSTLPAPLGGVGARAVGRDDDAAEADAAVGELGEAADRRPAGAVENVEEGTLAGERHRTVVIVDRGEALGGRRIAGPHGDGDDPLADGGQPLAGLDQAGGLVEKPEPRQPRRGEEGGVRDPLLDAAETGVHVAAQVDDLEVRPEAERHRLAAERRGAEDGALRQGGQRFRQRRDERIADIGARQRRGDGDAVGEPRRQVLGGVDGEIDLFRRSAPRRSPC